MKGAGTSGPAGRLVRRRPRGCSHLDAERLLVRRAGGGLDHQADRDVVGVRVPVLGSRREVERLVRHEREQRRGWRRHRERPGHRLAERLALREVRKAARVAQQLAKRHRMPGRRLTRQPLPDGVVEREHTVVDERQRDGSAERLRDARDPHVVVLPRPARIADRGDSERVHAERPSRAARSRSRSAGRPASPRAPGARGRARHPRRRRTAHPRRRTPRAQERQPS